MDGKTEQMIFGIILHAGNARTLAYNALKEAEADQFQAAKDLLEKAGDEVVKAHKIQNSIIQSEAAGVKLEVSLLGVHAQDHLMTAMSEMNLISGMVSLHEKMHRLQKAAGIHDNAKEC
jgi:PTS system cellobiose-specific IIA component